MDRSAFPNNPLEKQKIVYNGWASNRADETENPGSKISAVFFIPMGFGWKPDN